MEYYSPLERKAIFIFHTARVKWECYANWNKSHKKTNIIWFHLYQVFREVKIIETRCLPVAEEGENGDFNGFKASALQDEKGYD